MLANPQLQTCLVIQDVCNDWRRKNMPRRRMAGLLLGLASNAILTVAHAADTGALQGHVLSSTDKRPLAGARVQIRETGASTTTSSDGAFVFPKLAEGQYTLVVTAKRSPAVELTTVVRANDTTNDDVSVYAVVAALDHVTVTSQRAPNMVARAVQQNAANMVTVLSADEIRKMPDVNAAEAVVSIHVRPPEIEDRLLPGHVEGDFLKGANNQSSVGVLAERTSAWCCSPRWKTPPPLQR